MKRIAVFAAGIVFGTAGTAVAAQQNFWQHTHPRYSCTGVASGAQCTLRGTPYKVTVFGSNRTVGVFYGNEPMYACDAKTDECFEF